MNDFKLAMVVPPFGITGGPEQVAYNLTEELVKMKIDVTLFAPADWSTSAKHIPTLRHSLWNRPDLSELSDREKQDLITESQQRVLAYQKNFDLIHLHSQRYAAAVAKKAKVPCLLSIHSMIESDDFMKLKEAGVYPITLSQTQRGHLDSYATVPNGIPVSRIDYSTNLGKYFICVARLTPQKGIHRAISLIRNTDEKLLIIGRVGNDPERKKYFNEEIKPYLNENIQYLGEKSHDEVLSYLKAAKALLFTITKPEVFGMLVLESLACGTPVIGTTVGPLPEVIGDQLKISFLSDNDQELHEAIKLVNKKFDREQCRRYAEENFNSRMMAEKYLAVYQKILKNKLYERGQEI